MKKSIFNLFFLFITMISVVGCSKDDENQPLNPDELQVNQLSYLQSCLVQVDSLGHFIKRANGVPLAQFSADTTVVYLGVKDLNEAKERFRTFLPEETKTMELGDNITFYPTDGQGQSQGEVLFAPVNDTEGKVLASVTFSDKARIHHVTKLNFIVNEAWPYNASSPYNVGEVVNLNYGEEYVNYVCVRTAENGWRGLAVHLMSYKTDYANTTSMLATLPQTMDVSKVLRSNWDGFEKMFSAAGMNHLKDKDEGYYINYTGFMVFCCVNLYTMNRWWVFGGFVPHYGLSVHSFGQVN